MNYTNHVQNRYHTSPIKQYSPKVYHQQSYNNSFNQNTKPSSQLESDYIRIQKQNSLLRQQNQSLKKQLINLKKQQQLKTNTSLIDLKKQAHQIKQVKNRLQLLAKQCQVYEEIIQKMQQKNKKLLQDNRHLNQSLEIKDSKEKNQFQKLSKHLDDVLIQYSELELKMKAYDLEWTIWKEQWNKQKGYYLTKIRNLESGRSSSNSSRADLH